MADFREGEATKIKFFNKKHIESQK
jgi:hypothetical protein